MKAHDFFRNAARKNNRVFQTGSMQRSSSEFRKACELVRNGRLGKIKQVIVDVGGPSVPCDLPEETMEPGLNWDFWLGPAEQRPYNAVLSPRGVHTHFPNWRGYREYSGGAMTDAQTVLSITSRRRKRGIKLLAVFYKYAAPLELRRCRSAVRAIPNSSRRLS